VSAVYSQPSAIKAFSAPETAAAPQDIHIQPVALEETGARENKDVKHLSAKDDSAISIAETAGLEVSGVQDDDLTLPESGTAKSSQQVSDKQAIGAARQNGEDGSLILNQTGETDIDLVSAKMGYIAPIHIIVGPMNDPILKQQYRSPNKELEDKSDGK